MVVPVSKPNQLMPHSVSGWPSRPMIWPFTVVSELADSSWLLCGGGGGCSAAFTTMQGSLLTATISGMPVPLPTYCTKHADLGPFQTPSLQMHGDPRADLQQGHGAGHPDRRRLQTCTQE
jgi:hypothetical protein